MMMTDDFNAKKRGNLFPLKYKILTFFAMGTRLKWIKYLKSYFLQ